MTKTRSFDLGKMRHRIAVYATERVEDGAGGFDRKDPSGSELIGRYWCHIRPVTAKERQWGEQFTEVTTHMCWMRYNTLIKEGMTFRRIIGSNQVDYYVESFYDPDQLQQYQIVMLREGGPL